MLEATIGQALANANFVDKFQHTTEPIVSVPNDADANPALAPTAEPPELPEGSPPALIPPLT